jgi:hypothetical protein
VTTYTTSGSKDLACVVSNFEFVCTVKYIAKITGHSGFTTRTYTAVEVELDPVQGTTTPKANGLTFTNVTNLCETTPFAGGLICGTFFNVDTCLESYPANFSPKAIGGGGATDAHRYDRVVEIWKRNDAWVMNEWGVHDGNCGGDDLSEVFEIFPV